MAKGKKTGGRQKGTPNKTSTITREIIGDIANGMKPRLAEKIAELDAKEYVATWIKLVEFLTPKPQRLDMEIASTNSITIEDTLAKLAQENE